jgi:flagellar hook-associated protein 1 FlgK
MSGSITVDPERRIGVDGSLTFFRNDTDNTVIRVDYNRDESLQDVVKKINQAKAGVVAYMNQDNQLVLKGTTADDRRTNFMIRHVEDSGELLVGYTGLLNAAGPAGAFDYRKVDEIYKLRAPLQDITLTPIFHPAAFIQVSGDVKHDPASVAAARGRDIGGTGDFNAPNGSADGSNALIMADALKQRSRMFGHEPNPEEFYKALISKLGAESRATEDALQRQKDVVLHLQNQRQSIMGVSMDEEMANMLQFQHAYNASARVIQTQNELIETLIRLGA